MQSAAKIRGVASPADGMQAFAELCAYAGELAARRRYQPTDDIITKLLQADDARQELTAPEFELFVGGGLARRLIDPEAASLPIRYRWQWWSRGG